MIRIRHINGNSYVGIYRDALVLMDDSRDSSSNEYRVYWKSTYTHYLIVYKKDTLYIYRLKRVINDKTY